MKEDLRGEIIQKIEEFLEGKISKKEASQWAVKALTKRNFSSNELLLEDALTALAGLHDEDERFDTARQDLLYYRNCLLEVATYVVSVEFPAKAMENVTGG
jgi:hypothetical protein